MCVSCVGTVIPFTLSIGEPGWIARVEKGGSSDRLFNSRYREILVGYYHQTPF